MGGVSISVKIGYRLELVYRQFGRTVFPHVPITRRVTPHHVRSARDYLGQPRTLRFVRIVFDENKNKGSLRVRHDRRRRGVFNSGAKISPADKAERENSPPRR